MTSEKVIYIDIGSATVKVYGLTSNKLALLFTRSIPFKNGFDEHKGISTENKKELLATLEKVKKAYKDYMIKTYATAVFRKLDDKAKVKFIDEIYQKTGLFFNIISHEHENFYLELALTGQYKSKKELLLVNIGGGSTELVVLKDMLPVEKHNIELGIGTILSRFPGLNNRVSDTSLEEVVSFVKEKLPEFSHTVKEAFYNGGELMYMQLVGYPLQKNVLFKDPDHPSIIRSKDFRKKNKEVFTTIALAELEAKMPKDPKWMHGARACSAIAQAIFEKYKVDTIIPSDSNLIDGVVRQKVHNTKERRL